MTTVLLTGASGQLGQCLQTKIKQEGWSCLTPTHEQLDLSSSDFAENLKQYSPSIIINAAALTNLTLCQTQPELAQIVHANAVRDLAQFAEDLKIPLVQISTDYVLSGKINKPQSEQEPPMPLNTYGMSKLMGERYAKSFCEKHLIVRTAHLVSAKPATGKGSNLVLAIKNKILSGEPVKALADHHICLSHVDFVSDAILSLIKKQAPWGIYHVTSSNHSTVYEIACAIRDKLGVKTEIEQSFLKDDPAPFTRPAFSVLSCEKIKPYHSCPSWQNIIDLCLEETA